MKTTLAYRNKVLQASLHYSNSTGSLNFCQMEPNLCLKALMNAESTTAQSTLLPLGGQETSCTDRRELSNSEEIPRLDGPLSTALLHVLMRKYSSLSQVFESIEVLSSKCAGSVTDVDTLSLHVHSFTCSPHCPLDCTFPAQSL